MNKFLVLWLLLASIAQASLVGDIQRFASICRRRTLGSQFPPGHRPVKILLVKLIRGGHVLLETPYVAGPSHEYLKDYVDENIGGVERTIFAGEAVQDQSGRYYETIPTSGWAHRTGILSSSPKLFQLLTKHLPAKVSATGLQTKEYNPDYPHLDHRINRPGIQNYLHDVLEQSVAAFMMHTDAMVNNEGANVEANWKTMRTAMPIVREYLDLLKQDGRDVARIESMVDRINRGQELTKPELAQLLADVRSEWPQGKSQHERDSMITVYRLEN